MPLARRMTAPAAGSRNSDARPWLGPRRPRSALLILLVLAWVALAAGVASRSGAFWSRWVVDHSGSNYRRGGGCMIINPPTYPPTYPPHTHTGPRLTPAVNRSSSSRQRGSVPALSKPRRAAAAAAFLGPVGAAQPLPPAGLPLLLGRRGGGGKNKGIAGTMYVRLPSARRHFTPPLHNSPADDSLPPPTTHPNPKTKTPASASSSACWPPSSRC